MERVLWPWGFVPVREKEYKELTEKAEKLEAVKAAIYDRAGYAPAQVDKITKILEAEGCSN